MSGRPMVIVYILLAVLALLVAGVCFALLETASSETASSETASSETASSEKASSETASATEANPPGDPTLAIEVITDAEAIAKVVAKVAAASPAAEVWDEARLRRALEETWVLSPEVVASWERTTPNLGAMLDRAAADAELGERLRESALLGLIVLDEPASQNRMKALSEDASTTDIVADTLRELGSWVDHSDRALPSRVAANLEPYFDNESAAIRLRALDLALSLGLPAAESHAFSRLGALPPRDRMRLIRSLAERSFDPRLLALIEEAETGPRYKMSALEPLVEKGSGEIASRALSRYIEALGARYEEGQQMAQPTRWLASRWRAEDIPFLRRWSMEHRDQITRGYLLEGLARLRDAPTLERIASTVESGDLHDYDTRAAIEALGRAKAGSGDRATVALLVEKAANQASPTVAEAVARIGGDAAESALPALRAKLDIAERLDLDQQIGRRDIAAAAADFVETGLLERAKADARLAEAWSFEKLSVRVFELLSEAGTLVWFDSEADVIPVDHAELLRGLASKAGDAIMLDAVTQTFVSEDDDADPQMSADDMRLAYTVDAVVGERLYRFRCRDFWDYYDYQQVVSAANAMLRDSGAEERFVPIRSYGQDAALLLARPDQVAAAVEADWIAVDTNELSAVAAGQAFEKAARDALR